LKGTSVCQPAPIIRLPTRSNTNGCLNVPADSPRSSPAVTHFYTLPAAVNLVLLNFDGDVHATIAVILSANQSFNQTGKMQDTENSGVHLERLPSEQRLALNGVIIIVHTNT